MVRRGRCRLRPIRVRTRDIVVHNGWDFILDAGPDGGTVRVPDCGGQADGHPRDPAQLAWAEAAFAALPGLVRVWPTVWEVSPASLSPLRALLGAPSGG